MQEKIINNVDKGILLFYKQDAEYVRTDVSRVIFPIFFCNILAPFVTFHIKDKKCTQSLLSKYCFILVTTRIMLENDVYLGQLDRILTKP